MDNYQDSMRLYDIATNSAGTTQQKFGLYLEGTEAHLNKLKDTATSVWLNAFDSQSIRNATDALTYVIHGISELVKQFGSVPIFATVASIGLMTFSSSARNISGAAVGLVPKLIEMSKSMTAIEIASKAASRGIEILKISFRTLMSATLIGVAIAGVSYLVEQLTEYFSNQQHELDVLKEKNDEMAQSWRDHGSQISSLVDEYEKLDKKASTATLNTSELQRYQQIQEQLAQLSPTFVDGVDAEGKARLKNVDAIKQETEELQKKAKQQAQDTVQNFSTTIVADSGNIQKKKAEIESLQKEISNLSGYTNVNLSLSDTASISNELEKANKKLIVDQSDYDDLVKVSNQHIQENASAILQSVGNTEALDAATIRYIESLSKGKTVNDFPNQGAAMAYTEQLQQQAKTVVSIFNVIQNASKFDFGQNGQNAIAEQTRFIEALQQEVAKAGLSQDWLNGVLEQFNLKLKTSSSGVVDLDSMHQQLVSDMANVIKQTKDLNDAIDKQASGHKLTADEISSLTQKYPELEQALEIENGQLVLSTQALKAKRDAIVDGVNTSITAKQQELDALKAATKSELESYGVVVGAVLDLTQARQYAAQAQEQIHNQVLAQLQREADATDGLVALNSAQRNALFGSNPGLTTHIEDSLAKIQAAQDLLDKYKGQLSTGMNFSTTSDNPAKSKNAVDPYVSDEYQKQLDLLDAEQKKIQANTESYNNLSPQYRDGLKQEISVLKEKQDLAHNERLKLDEELATARSRLSSASDQEAKNKYLKEIDDIQKKIGQMGSSWMDYAKAISEAERKVEQSMSGEITDKREQSTKKLTDSLTKLDIAQKQNDITLAGLNETSAEYVQIQQDQIDIINQKEAVHNKIADAYRDENAQLEKLLENQDLDLVVRDEIQKKIESNTKAITDEQKSWMDLEESKKQAYKKYADDIVSSIKNAYEQEKKIALDTEEARHKKRIDNIDAETKAYEDSTNAIIQQIDRQSAEEDYNSNLKKEQDSRAILQRQIDALSMDNSPEAKSRIIDLKKQLADEDEKIEKIKNDRERDLRKQNLQDQLDDFKDKKQKEKDEEDALYEQTKDQFQKEYDAKINNETLFSQIRRSLYEGDTKFVLSQLELVKKSFSDITKLATDAGVYVAPDTSSNIDSGLQKSTNSMNAMQIANAKAKIAEYGQKWQLAKSDDERNYWHDQAVQVGTSAGGTYDDKSGEWTFPAASYDTGGYTGSWGSNGKIAILHEKELILNQDDTQNVLKTVGIADRIANMFFGGNVSDVMGRIAKFVMPSVAVPKLDTSVVNSRNDTSNTIHLEVNIDKVMGGKDGADTLIQETYRGLNKLGIRLG